METQTSLSFAARRGAGVIAVVASVTLITRFYLRLQQSEGVLDALSYMAQYFTLLTNAMTLIMMVWIALGRELSPRVIKAVTIAIVCVGLFYHILLAHLVSLSGIELWADHGTHTFVPILSGLWWLFLASKPPLKASDMLIWVAWPVLYCTYILIRANFSGFYPYPFLNLPELGWGGLSVSIAGLLVSFVIVGLAITAFGRLVSGIKN